MKTYKKTHASKTALNAHIEKIKARKGCYKLKGMTISYSFPIPLKEGKATLFENDGINYPVYAVLINGKKCFISKEDGMYGKPYWVEVKREKQYWNAVKHFSTYPFESNIGDTKAEAISFLLEKYK